MKQILSVAFLFLAQTLSAQNSFVKKDLQAEWMVFSEGKYRNYQETDQVNAIHILLEPSRYRGDKLLLEDDDEFSVFLNNQLWIDRTKRVVLVMDSLPAKLLISLYRKEDITTKNLKTSIVTELSAMSMSGPLTREGNDARNFVIAAGLLLIVFFVFILRFNPKLTFHYFSLSKLFSLRESDESQMFARIASSANVLFYLFASLLVGYVLMVMVIGLSPEYKLQHFLKAQSFMDISVRWLQISGIIVLAFFCKAVVLTLLSVLFGLGDQSGFQFLGFIRSTLLVAAVLAVCTGLYFIMNGSNERWYSFFYSSLSWLMAGWIILIFLKLIRRAPFTVFHLFSYICATELIPFLIAVKVLYE